MGTKNKIKKFLFTIGGYSGTTYIIELSYDHLIVTQQEGHECPTELPTWISIADLSEWQGVVDYLATRKWKEHYSDDDILDGTSWNVELKSKLFSINSSGSNKYPPGFSKLISLINKITKPYGININ